MRDVGAEIVVSNEVLAKSFVNEIIGSMEKHQFAWWRITRLL